MKSLVLVLLSFVITGCGSSAPTIPQGAVGAQGEAGPTGATGPQGAAGENANYQDWNFRSSYSSAVISGSTSTQETTFKYYSSGSLIRTCVQTIATTTMTHSSVINVSFTGGSGCPVNYSYLQCVTGYTPNSGDTDCQ